MTRAQRLFNLAYLATAMSVGFIAYVWSVGRQRKRLPDDDVNVLMIRKRSGEIYQWTYNDGEAARQRVVRAILDAAHDPELSLDFEDAWELIGRMPRRSDAVWSLGEGAGT